MRVLVTASEIDLSLLPFLDASNAPEEAAALARLNSEEIEPVIRRGLGYKLRIYSPHGEQNLHRPDFDEIYNDIQLRLLKRLRALKDDRAQNQIVNLRGYVATVTRNACDEYLRHRYPLRRSLKDKIRRHLLSNSEFALWEDTEHNWRAGLSGWQDSNGALKDEPGELQQRLKTEWQTVDVQHLELHDLLMTIFRVARTPVELDQLTELIASCWGIEDHPAEPLEANTFAPLDEQLGPDISPANGAQSYTVAVTDAELNEVATSPPLNATEWQIPKPLKQGGIYSWQVTALKDGVKITSPVLPAPQAKFKVIDRTTSEMLQQTQRAYPDSHLTLGVLYAEAGLLDEAEQELRVLARDNPRASVAQKLLRQVQSLKAQL